MTYEKLAAKVSNYGGVLTMQMSELRDIHGAIRLGANVVAGISESLSDQGLGHFPQELPLEQSYTVRVYKKIHQVGRIIEACLQPGEKSDKVLRSMVDTDSDDIIRKIRERVCD